MAKKIYIGEILGEVMNKVSYLQADMQAVANQMVAVAKNTSYLENLYLATGRRSNVTYSAGDDTLSARKTADLHLETISYTLGEATTLNSFGGFTFYRAINDSGSLESMNTIDVSSFSELSFIPYVDEVSDTGLVEVHLEIDDVLVPGSALSATEPGKVFGSRLSIDCSGLDVLELKMVIETPSGIGRYCGISSVYGKLANGSIKLWNYAASSVISLKKIKVASGFDSAQFTLMPVTGLAVAGWDCITWLIENNNEYTRIDVLDSGGNLLLRNIKSGEALSELNAISFYLRFTFQKIGGVSPELAAVSYLYLT